MKLFYREAEQRAPEPLEGEGEEGEGTGERGEGSGAGKQGVELEKTDLNENGKKNDS